jgi:hypothetical protein
MPGKRAALARRGRAEPVEGQPKSPQKGQKVSATQRAPLGIYRAADAYEGLIEFLGTCFGREVGSPRAFITCVGGKRRDTAPE